MHSPRLKLGCCHGRVVSIGWQADPWGQLKSRHCLGSSAKGCRGVMSFLTRSVRSVTVATSSVSSGGDRSVSVSVQGQRAQR